MSNGPGTSSTQRGTPYGESRLKGLSVLASQGGSLFPQRVAELRHRITRSYSALLSHHPSMASWVARDLTAWNRWEYESQLFGILRAGTLADPAAELAVRNYLATIPRNKAQIAIQ